MHAGPIRLTVFRALYGLSAISALAAATLIITSFFIADRAPQSTESFVLHSVVAVFFAGIGFLLFGVSRNVVAIGKLDHSSDHGHAGGLRRAFARLLNFLIAGGVLMAIVMLFLTYAFLARINQNFAVFG